MSENWSDDDSSTNPTVQSQQFSSNNNYNQGSNRYGSDNYRNSNNKRGRGNFKGESRGDYNRDDSGRQYKRSFTSENEEQSTMYVENSKLGKLIGKRGANIKELQDQSGATVQVNINCIFKRNFSLLIIFYYLPKFFNQF